MVADLKEISDKDEVSKKIIKYTECFDLLDRLGADNCVDPEDFDQEDLDDDLFKNLQISDIEELFNEDKKLSFISETSPRHETKIEQDTPFSGLDSYTKGCLESLSEKAKYIDDEPLIMDQDSDYKLEDDDLQFMDFDQ